MGAMVAVVSKKGENMVPEVVDALRELTHRGTDAHGIATHDSVLITKSLEEMPTEKFRSNMALGHNLSRIFLTDRPQPVLSDGFSLVFDGRLFPSADLPDVDEVLKRLKPDPQRNAEHVIEKLEGSYVFAVACPSRILVGRDSMGANPLYYGESESISAVASERKALWALRIRNVKSFPPGNLAEVSFRGFSFQPIRMITQALTRSIDAETAVTSLQDLLLEATRKRLSDVKEVAVAFSGGLDSSVIAVLAKICGKRVQLVTVGLKNQPETRHAEAAARALGFSFHLRTYTLGDVEQVLPKVLWLIEEPDAVKVSVAIPLYWTATTASKLGCDVLLAGQGGDELFGGYQRYLREYAESGVLTVRDTMFRDLAFSYERNFQRDNQVCSLHRVELRLPFADFKVANFSQSLPVSLKIESAEDHLRKTVLRQVARNLGIPLTIVNKTKKAIQYSTGVDKALRKLARREGLTTREYLLKVFRGVYPNVAL